MINRIGPLTAIEFPQGVAAAGTAANGAAAGASKSSSGAAKTAGTKTESSKEKSDQKLLDAAEEFEGLLLAQMLKTARESASGGWLGSGAEQSMSSTMELAETQLARAMAEQGALGIGKLLANKIGSQAAAARTVDPEGQTPAKMPAQANEAGVSVTRDAGKISTEPPAARVAAEQPIPNQPIAPKLHEVR